MTLFYSTPFLYLIAHFLKPTRPTFCRQNKGEGHQSLADLLYLNKISSEPECDCTMKHDDKNCDRHKHNDGADYDNTCESCHLCCRDNFFINCFSRICVDLLNVIFMVGLVFLYVEVFWDFV